MIRISVSSKGFAVRRFTAVLWSPPRLQPPQPQVPPSTKFQVRRFTGVLWSPTRLQPPSHRFPVYKVPGPQVPRRQVSPPPSRLTALNPYKFKKEFPTTQHLPERNPPAWDFRRGTFGGKRRPPRGTRPHGTGPSAAADAERANCCLPHGRRPLRGPRGQNSIICSTEGTVLQMVASRADIGK